MRWIKHLFDFGRARRRFPPATLSAIQHAVAADERRHRGEICFAVEGALPFGALIARQSPRARAEAVFSQLRVWDTRDNVGVLVYVLLADHAIEIVADRGIAALIDADEWNVICERLRVRFKAGEFEAGAIDAVAAIGALLARHFPADGNDNPDELPNRPVLL